MQRIRLGLSAAVWTGYAESGGTVSMRAETADGRKCMWRRGLGQPLRVRLSTTARAACAESGGMFFMRAATEDGRNCMRRSELRSASRPLRARLPVTADGMKCMWRRGLGRPLRVRLSTTAWASCAESGGRVFTQATAARGILCGGLSLVERSIRLHPSATVRARLCRIGRNIFHADENGGQEELYAED